MCVCVWNQKNVRVCVEPEECAYVCVCVEPEECACV